MRGYKGEDPKLFPLVVYAPLGYIAHFITGISLCKNIALVDITSSDTAVGTGDQARTKILQSLNGVFVTLKLPIVFVTSLRQALSILICYKLHKIGNLSNLLLHRIRFSRQQRHDFSPKIQQMPYGKISFCLKTSLKQISRKKTVYTKNNIVKF